jgi:hypothetical protein
MNPLKFSGFISNESLRGNSSSRAHAAITSFCVTRSYIALVVSAALLLPLLAQTDEKRTLRSSLRTFILSS